MEGIPLTLEFSGGINLVSHDAGNGLLNILHPFCHLGVAHLVHLLDELVVLLPERHLVAVCLDSEMIASYFPAAMVLNVVVSLQVINHICCLHRKVTAVNSCHLFFS